MKAIMFGAYYCGYCAKYWDEVMEPLVDEGYHVEYVDAMKHPKLAERYHVRNLPNTVIVDDTGRAQVTITGKPDQDAIRALLT